MHLTKHKPCDKRHLPLWAIICYGVAALALLLLIVATASPTFADAYNSTVGAFLRALLAHMTSWLPFSLAELLLYCMLPLLVFLVVLAYRHWSDTWREVFVFLGCILAVASILFSLFAAGFGVGHRTHALHERLAFDEVEVTADSLGETTSVLVEKLNALAPEIQYGEDGFSVMPYSLREMNARLLAAYDPICDRYPFVQRLNSRIKPILASRAMSYTHITGVYSFYTGEANLNTYFPDYTLPFTASHELAHQRGIARENEANFIAFLVTESSDDTYIRYSAYLNLLEYVASALYATDVDMYREAMGDLCEDVKNELRAYSDFFDQFRDSAIANVSDAVNDTYLKINGNKAGSQSYSLVVELAVAYYCS